VSTKILPFPAQREEWKEETKKKLRGDKGVPGVLSFLGAGCRLRKQNAFFLKINNKETTRNIDVKQKRKSHLITKECSYPIMIGNWKWLKWEKLKLASSNDTGETPKAAMQEQLPVRNFFPVLIELATSDVSQVYQQGREQIK
jgi:hypothetical protein